MTTRSLKETEVIEHVTTLDGNHATQYNLIWTDVWLLGEARVLSKGALQPTTFRIKDSTEFTVEAR